MSKKPNDLTTTSRLIEIIFFIMVFYLILRLIIHWATMTEAPESTHSNPQNTIFSEQTQP